MSCNGIHLLSIIGLHLTFFDLIKFVHDHKLGFFFLMGGDK